MKQENKTKSVKKFSVKMLLAMVFGGVLGGFFGAFYVLLSWESGSISDNVDKDGSEYIGSRDAGDKYYFCSGRRDLPEKVG